MYTNMQNTQKRYIEYQKLDVAISQLAVVSVKI